VIELRVEEVARATDGRVEGDPAVVVDAVATDSRAMPPGRPLFVALPGEQADGHAFAADAVARGALAVLASRPLPDLDVPVVVVADTWVALRTLAGAVRRRVDPVAVAITGSVGKTTVKDLTAAAVGAAHRTHAASGSYNNELGVPLTLLGIAGDTEVVVTEVGARRVGDIDLLGRLVAPDVAVVTAVAGVHLELFGTLDAVARTKAELVACLDPDGVAVLNVADPRVAAMAERAPSVLRVGTDVADADVRATRVVLDRRARAAAEIATPWGPTEVRLPVAGRHHVLNALLALAVAGHLGGDLDAAAAAIARAAVSPWRGAVDEAGGVVVVNDAYNSNPLAAAAALDTLQAIERTGRTWAVLGLMAEIGATSYDEHRALGRRCAEHGVDHLVVVGADAAPMAAGAVDAGMPPGNVEEVDDAAAALALLVPRVGPGDVVLVKASRVAGLEAVADGLVAARRDAAEVGS
jgi:UDP-N-acetylmuramoyl-tripeptide--D-alanyl-D-alanine ligase